MERCLLKRTPKRVFLFMKIKNRIFFSVKCTLYIACLMFYIVRCTMNIWIKHRLNLRMYYFFFLLSIGINWQKWFQSHKNPEKLGIGQIFVQPHQSNRKWLNLPHSFILLYTPTFSIWPVQLPCSLYNVQTFFILLFSIKFLLFWID